MSNEQGGGLGKTWSAAALRCERGRARSGRGSAGEPMGADGQRTGNGARRESRTENRENRTGRAAQSRAGQAGQARTAQRITVLGAWLGSPEHTHSRQGRQGLSHRYTSTLRRFSIASMLIACRECLPSRPGPCDRAFPRIRMLIHSDSAANKTPLRVPLSNFLTPCPPHPQLSCCTSAHSRHYHYHYSALSCENTLPRQKLLRHSRQCPLPLLLTVLPPQPPLLTSRCNSTPMLHRNK